MHPNLKLRQSEDLEIFRCIGAACEDTCCGDWGVSIDRKTYEKYQACGDPELQSPLHEFVTINTANGNDQDFARITLTDNRCPFLAEGLCSIQLKLGESYLSNTCASYPRSVNVIDATVERSLYLSCPEAARLVLLNQSSSELKDQTAEAGDRAIQGAPTLDSLHANRAKTSYPHFQQVRELFLDVLREVAYPRWQRLAILARQAEELNAILNSSQSPDEQAPATGEFVRRSRDCLRAKFIEVSGVVEARPLIQIETVLELIVARIGSDFTASRFLECYREFMEGIRWGPDSTIEDIACRLMEARLDSYAPFINRHEYLLDNFMVNYAFRTVLPYGHREIDQKMGIEYA